MGQTTPGRGGLQRHREGPGGDHTSPCGARLVRSPRGETPGAGEPDPTPFCSCARAAPQMEKAWPTEDSRPQAQKRGQPPPRHRNRKPKEATGIGPRGGPREDLEYVSQWESLGEGSTQRASPRTRETEAHRVQSRDSHTADCLPPKFHEFNQHYPELTFFKVSWGESRLRGPTPKEGHTGLRDHSSQGNKGVGSLELTREVSLREIIIQK